MVYNKERPLVDTDKYRELLQCGRQGEYNLPQIEDWLELSSVIEEMQIET
jgi:hypothetical protein